MSCLPHDTDCDEVILRLARTFGPQSTLESKFCEEYSEEFDEAPEWKLLEEAVESGHLLPSEIIHEFGNAFINELSPASCKILRRIDRTFLQAVGLGETSSLWVLSLRLIRESERLTEGVVLKDLTIADDLKSDGLFLLVEAAEAGYARAQWMLGERFSRMDQGLEEGVRLLGMAASQNFEPAKERLKELYELIGTLVPVPIERKWLRRFSQAGVAEAQFDFANNLWLKGELRASFAWMLESAKAGHQKAQKRLAFCYEIGDGCEKDLQQAEYWSSLSSHIEDSDEVSEDMAETTQVSPSQTTALEQPPVQKEDADPIEVTHETSEAGLDCDAASEPMNEPKTELVLTSEDRPHEHPLETKELLVEVQAPKIEPVSETTEENEGSNFPIPAADTKKGFVSRFRRSFADVLKRLAERISGDSKSSKDGK